MAGFETNRKFRRDYDRIFKKDPAAANVFLLLAELAEAKGQIKFAWPLPEAEIQRLMAARFDAVMPSSPDAVMQSYTSYLFGFLSAIAR